MMKKILVLLLCGITLAGILAGCSRENQAETENNENYEAVTDGGDMAMNTERITPSETIEELEEGLSIVRYEDDYGLDAVPYPWQMRMADICLAGILTGTPVTL